MVRGFYAAASGALSQQKTINIISNNIANTTTAGYKSQATVGKTFGEHMLSRYNGEDGGNPENIGMASYIKTIDSDYIDVSQGNLEPTGRSLDLGISGEGYFLIKDDANNEFITRNGQFAMDKDGYLKLNGVGFVMNEGKGKIKLNSANFSVDGAGNIADDKSLKEKLYIAKIKEDSVLEKAADGVLKSASGYDKADGTKTGIAQGTIEKSNVDMAKEMTRIMASQGNFNSCSQVIKIFDRINEITANQIGKL